ncbi:NETWORKED 1A protein, partial [Nymphaea thermarum]
DDRSNHGNYTSSVHQWSEDKGGEKQDGLQELHKLLAKIEAIDVTVGGFEDIKKEYHEVKLIKEALENELNILAEEIVLKSKEMTSIHEDKEKLEIESYELLEELDQCLFREKYFKCELEAKAEEIELWQTSSETLYHDLESCSIHEMLIEQKWLELMGACESLEIKSQHETKKLLDDIAARSVEVDELQKKIMKLEEINEEMSERSNKNLSLVSSVKESLSSLEDRCLAALGDRASGTHKGDGLHDQQNITSLVPEPALKCAGTEKVVLELQELLVKFKTVERLVVELSQLSHFIKDKGTGARVAGSFGKGRTEDTEADEQMLELWETAERQSSHETENLTSVKGASRDVDSEKIISTKKAQKNQEHELSELQVEREVAVDKIEVSCESENKRVRDMLTSESHRLMDLQNNAQELNRRFEKLRNGSNADGLEIDNAIEQLRGIELSILQLVELNHKLLKNNQSSSIISSERETGKSDALTGRTEDLPDIDRSHVQEARRRSEKIEQFEIELQRMEFILRKLEDGHVKRIHASVEKRARVLLRDYLYGGRGNRKQKKAPFCGCMRLLTKDD